MAACIDVGIFAEECELPRFSLSLSPYRLHLTGVGGGVVSSSIGNSIRCHAGFDAGYV
jgi:hypothetical protein